MAKTSSLAVQRWEGLAEKTHYRVGDLADACNMSVRHLERQFRQELGRTPQNWLDELRRLAAQQRLLSGDPEKNVASALGFKQESHFCRKFKQWTGITPTAFVAASSLAARNVANR